MREEDQIKINVLWFMAASTSQSIRLCPPASVAIGNGCGSIDTLNQIISNICTGESAKDEVTLALRKLLEEEARETNVGVLLLFTEQLYDRISNLIESNDVVDNLGALRIMDELIDVSLGEGASKISNLCNYLHIVFEVKRNPEILILASRTLGHVVRSGGTTMADEVEHQVRTALDWLHDDRVAYRRFAAVLILKEMAENASTVFNVFIPDFVDAIWIALRDSTLAVRVEAVEALRACLHVIENRETRWRVEWYYRMFEAAQSGLGKNAHAYSIHGSLLAVGELLRNSGEFMMSRYREVAEMVLTYLEHRDRLVRLSITSLLPRIAHFLCDRFVTNYLTICMNHIITVLRIPSERASGFIALGELAGVLDGELINYLPTITDHLREAIVPRKGKPSLEALTCVGNMAKYMGSAMESHARGLLNNMISAGLSHTLLDALDQIADSIPSMLPTIQDRLLECILGALSKPHNIQMGRKSIKSITQQASDPNVCALAQQALQALTRFNFKGHKLLEFARESVILYLDDEKGVTRKDAALCCCKLVTNSLSFGGASTQFGVIGFNQNERNERNLVGEILDKLLISAVADADLIVRVSVFSSLHGNDGFDDFLRELNSLTAICAAFNDENFVVREYAVSVAGRLSVKNPACVLPKLRRYLLQLLTYLKQSADSKCREESAKLLGCLIRNCQRLVLPYIIKETHKALVANLYGGSGTGANNGIVSAVLVTVGDLARAGGSEVRPYVPELMPLIVEFVLDGADAAKLEVAVTTLGQVTQSTGFVITPYIEYPHLLGSLLTLLNGELPWSTRQEVFKVIGIIGALDPYVHKRNRQILLGSHGEVTFGASNSGQHIHSIDDPPMDLWPSYANPDDYCSTVAINFLMRMLRNPSHASNHKKVVDSIMFIFKSMGLASVPFLPKVLPDFLHIVRTSDEVMRNCIRWNLGVLVSIVRQHIRKYLPELLSLIAEMWSSFSLPVINRSAPGLSILHLLEHLCVVFNDEIADHLPSIIPCFIQILSDAERCGDYTYVHHIFHTLEIFGGILDGYMHLLFPEFIRLFKIDAPVSVRRASIKTLTILIPRVQVTGHTSALVHNLNLVLDGKNEELRKDAADALCCLAIEEEFTHFIPSIHKLLLKHQMRHKAFEDIERRFHKHEPLIMRINPAHRLRQSSVKIMHCPFNEKENVPYEDGSDSQRKHRSHQVNDNRLRIAGEASQCSTREDWSEWMRHFSMELLRESPAPALRTCAKLSQLQPLVGRELFAAGFFSSWTQLNDTTKKQFVRSLEMAFSSSHIPPEILATLLNLAELMEHDEKPLPIDIRLLGALAEKCQAFAKALHYKEIEFEGARSKKMDVNAVEVVEGLLHINNQLHQHEAAVGILTYAQQHLDVQLKESWYEKLQRWDDALNAYTAKACQTSNSPNDALDATLGRMRCLAALARWDELNRLCKDYWTSAETSTRLEIAPMAASAAWNMGEWDQMEVYVSRMDETKYRISRNSTISGDGSSNGAFLKAVVLVRRGKYDEARKFIERARKCLATELAPLVLESYERAYSNMVRVQQLSELEEVIDYCTLPVGNPVSEDRRAVIRNMWSVRIQGAKRNVEVWQSLLAVRTLVLPPKEDIESWLKFASLCRKSGRFAQARSTLVGLMQYGPETSSPGSILYKGPPQVMLAYYKYQWSLGEELVRKEAFENLQELAKELSTAPDTPFILTTGLMSVSNSNVPLLARVQLKLGTWKWTLSPELDDDSIQEIIVSLKNATLSATNWAKAWHTWALFNTTVIPHYIASGSPGLAPQFAVSAVTGYFHSIACGSHAKGVDDSLQDILRLLTLWFTYGDNVEVQLALKKGFAHVNINTWLAVLPQIIARIHSTKDAVRELIQSILVRIGERHPQALMYPLLVACKSISTMRKTAAQEVVDKVRQHSGILVDQAQLVSKELIRVAILWHEMWHEGFEEASRLYFGEHNNEGMLKVLEPLHVSLEEAAKRNDTSLTEKAFIQTYHNELLEAYERCMKYKITGKEAELTQAWDLYYNVFHRIDKHLHSLKTLDLQFVSPELLDCRNLELAVPGTYRAEAPVVTIASFSPQLEVITSKQRPRKLTIHGSDGEDYTFLLKGHEDLRLDERVMQLFGLVNTLLENSRDTAEKDLSIQRYAVIPLSPNSGLIGWVPNCDTFHHLICEYRNARKIPLNREHRLMLSFAPKYETLSVIGKVEVFEFSLAHSDGRDLARVLWLKSRTSEIWLDRRTNYTRSLAVMSMVGYLLGLGDRHPSNLMLHRFSGKILHIDFGDCFEAAMTREKFPEKVPFRLTRMLVKAMEVSGIEGNFRSTCENVMQVLRTNKGSVMAMMEAFVHDPLINWRLFNLNEVPQTTSILSSQTAPVESNEVPPPPIKLLSQPQRSTREKVTLKAVKQLDDANDVLNVRAMDVMSKMTNKLTGHDFPTKSSCLPISPIKPPEANPHFNTFLNRETYEIGRSLSVEMQVQKLIKQATSNENLCQNYIGWCPFW